MHLKILTIFTSLFSLFTPFEGDVILGNESKQDPLPHVFMIGEYESDYEDIMEGCDKLLLSVCNESMDDAYVNWLIMLSDIEEYAEQVGFDIKGIKIWLNVFWNADGTIKHMVYYPKPNSRNMDFSLLSEFLNKFVAGYKSKLAHPECFSHYGSGSFPTFADYFLKERAQK